jgi:hypothetical protein
MSEGTLTPIDFTLGVAVVFGARVGLGVFQGTIDISAIIADIDPADVILFEGRREILNGGGLKTYASRRITGAFLQSQIDAGKTPDDLIYFAPYSLPNLYNGDLSLTWEAGTPKTINWQHVNMNTGQ